MFGEKIQEKNPPLTSAIEIAFRYSHEIERGKKWKGVHYGDSLAALNLLLNEGGCPYYNSKDFQFDMRGDRYDEFQRLENLLYAYSIQSKRIDAGKRTAGMFSRITPEQKQEELIRKFACSNYST